LEALEDRTLLTLFTVSAVPDATADQEAVAQVGYSSGERPVIRAGVFGAARPAGMGNHQGAFYVGSASDLLEIDTAPDVGQNYGDPITVSFLFSYSSSLQNFDGYPPPNTSYVTWHGFLDAGDAAQPLFDGSFSTDYSNGDEVQDARSIQIHMNVGDPIYVHVWSNGQAYAAEPHFKDWVAFNANFVVQDDASNAPTLATIRTGLSPLLAQNRPLEQSLGASRLRDASTVLAVRDVHPLELHWTHLGRVSNAMGLENASCALGHHPAVNHLMAELSPDQSPLSQEIGS
jgi:hypothetical protein